MSLEEVIQQQHFESVKQKAKVNVMYTSQWLMNHMKELLKAFDITFQQYNVLRILRGQYPDPISTSDIRCRMIDKMSDTSRIVERLFRSGLVQRSECRNDRRLVDVKISKSGLELLTQIDPLILKHDNLMQLSDEEAEQLIYLLDKARGNADTSC